MAHQEDLSKLTYAELRELAGLIEKQIVITERKTLDQAKHQIYAIAHGLGISLKELMDRTGMTKELATGKTSPPIQRKVSTTRYAHPDNKNIVWLGSGARPRWLKELLDKGVTLDQLRVSGA